MSRLRTVLLDIGEAPGDTRAFTHVGDRKIKLFDMGGGSAPAAPTSQNVTQTSIPEYARPYVETMLGKAQSLTQSDQPTSYTGQRVAGFTPMQQQAFSNLQGMDVAEQVGQGTNLANTAGIGALGAGQAYANQATNPASVQSYMSPYMQNVVDWQKDQAVADYGRQLPGMQAAQIGQGAFGGSRTAIMQSEAQRNLQNQLAGIQALGSQKAYDSATQQQQFGANLGMQGYQTAGQQAQTLGQLGQTQYGQQMGITSGLQSAGGQQQALEQQNLSNNYQDYLNQLNYPYKQLGFMSDILRGMPLTQQSQSVYQAPPSATNQLMAYGLGAYGLGNLFGGTPKKAGGVIKAFAAGGGVLGDLSRIPEQTLQQAALGKSDMIGAEDAQRELRRRVEIRRAVHGQQAQAQMAQPPMAGGMDAGVGALNPGNMDFADGGIVAFADRGLVQDAPVRSTSGGESWFLDVPEEIRDPSTSFYKAIPNPLYSQLSPLVFPTRAEAERVYKNTYQALYPKAGAAAPAAYSPAPSDDIYPRPASSVTASQAAPSVAALRATRTATPTPAAPASPGGLAMGAQDYSGASPTGVERLLSATPESEMDSIKRYAVMSESLTKADRDALSAKEEAIRKKTEGDKGNRLDTARGVTALGAASELLASGRNRAASIGAALKLAAGEGKEYADKEQKIGDKMDASDLAAAQSRLALKQGDVQLGATLMGRSQEMRVKAAEAAGTIAYRRAMVQLEGQGLSIKEMQARAEAAKHDAETHILIPALAARYNAEARVAGAKGQVDPVKARDMAADNAMAWVKTMAAADPTFMRKNPNAYEDRVRSIYAYLTTGQMPAAQGLQSDQVPGAVAGKISVQ